VLGLTRSNTGAQALRQAGAEVHQGTLEEPDSLARGAAQADAVIHTAFDHDFSNFAANCEKDRCVIAAMGEALRGSDRPLVITSGTGMGILAPGQLASEEVTNLEHPNPRVASEMASVALLDAGVNVSVVRLPQVHDPVKQGLITPLVAIARAKRLAAYVGEGLNRWPAAHVLDVARLYRLALERGLPGVRYNAVAEEGIAVRDITAAIGHGLDVPVASISAEQAADYYGWMAIFASLDMPASSAKTREWLNWNPTGPGLLADLAAMDYAATTDS
jgi:nucleoside-diphosphate-sugar epimerase